MEKLDSSWVWLGKEFLNSESVSYSDPTTFKESVKSAMFANALRLLKETGQINPPYDPERIAEIRKAKILKLPLEYDGMLIPTKDGFIMKINSNMPLVHQRFVCAHEIAHTFFFNIGTSPPSKSFITDKNRHWAEENIANRIAREILMPEPVIRGYLEQAKPPYIEDFKQIMKLFFVSSEVLARRIRELETWKALILIFEMGDDFEIKLQSTFNCGYKKLSVAKKGTPIKDPIFYNILHKAYIDEDRVITRENIKISIGDFKKHCIRIGSSYIGNSPAKILTIISL